MEGTISRAVPMGSTYKQMFDAQVQLSASFEYFQQQRAEKVRHSQENVARLPPVLPDRIPVAKTFRAQLGEGILNERQLHWARSLPNDHTTENPQVRRSRHGVPFPESLTRSIDEQEKTVLNLPEVVVPPKSSAHVVDKIATGKKARHEEACVRFRERLQHISDAFEPEVSQLATRLAHSVCSYEAEMASSMAVLLHEKDLTVFSAEDLSAAWTRTRTASGHIRAEMEAFDQAVTALEDRRLNEVCECLLSLTRDVYSVSSLAEADLQRAVDREAQKINQTLLINRRCMAEMLTRLATRNLQHEKQLRAEWDRVEHEWREAQCRQAVSRFRAWLQSDEMSQPASVARLRRRWDEQREGLLAERDRLLEQVSELEPPSLKPALVDQWMERVVAVLRRLDELDTDSVAAIEREQHRLKEVAVQRAEAEEHWLVQHLVCDASTARCLGQTEMLPCLSEQASQSERTLAQLLADLDQVRHATSAQLSALHEFCKMASALWEQHDRDVADKERELKSWLDACRRNHDGVNQDRENKLDLLLDKLRQQANEQALDDVMKQVKRQLDAIEAGYRDFHSEEVSMLHKYPAMVDDAVSSYEAALARYLSVRVQAASEESSSAAFFLTEAPAECSVRQSVLSPDKVARLQASVCANMRRHADTWRSESSLRARKVVESKSRELQSELELRVHLHEPRWKRTEADIRNLRAAELVLHSERVQRHTAGVDRELEELQARFESLLMEHNELRSAFKTRIEQMDAIFSSATKSSSVSLLQEQLKTELDRYMERIRGSLRLFQQEMESGTKRLRDSNGALRKSFKVFSEGGNFSADEVHSFSRGLEQLARRIDRAEIDVLKQFEAIERRRLDDAARLCGQFEDRFKFHLVDLVFMEKISRYLTNTQVKIKAEVARSNAQAHQLSAALASLQTNTDTLQQPRVDQKACSASALTDELRQLLLTLSTRATYLNVVVQQEAASKPSKPAETGQPSPEPAGAKAGEDPSIQTIHQLYNGREEKAQNDDDKLSPAKKVKAALRLRKRSSVSARRSDSKTTSGRASKARMTVMDVYKVYSDDEDDEAEPQPVGEATHLLDIIRRGIDDCLAGLVAAGEMFYKQKNNRKVTRPQALQDTFDEFYQVIVDKLRSYRAQCEEYHNQCLQEFRDQLERLESTASLLPRLVIRELVDGHLAQLKAKLAEQERLFVAQQTALEQQKQAYQRELRPPLGHPDRRGELEALDRKEQQRKEQFDECLQQHCTSVQALLKEQRRELANNMHALSAELVQLFDSMLVVDEVSKGKYIPPRRTTSELLRQKKAGIPLDQKVELRSIDRAAKKWPGLSSHGRALTVDILARKSTFGHLQLFQARNDAFQEMETRINGWADATTRKKDTLGQDEQRWTATWKRSLQSLKGLYGEH